MCSKSLCTVTYSLLFLHPASSCPLNASDIRRHLRRCGQLRTSSKLSSKLLRKRRFWIFKVHSQSFSCRRVQWDFYIFSLDYQVYKNRRGNSNIKDSRQMHCRNWNIATYGSVRHVLFQLHNGQRGHSRQTSRWPAAVNVYRDDSPPHPHNPSRVVAGCYCDKGLFASALDHRD